MFNIAVFERNIEDIQKIEKCLNSFLFNECEYFIYAFNDEDAFLEFFENSDIKFNLICLDADSRTNLGFSAAEQIRKVDVKVNIIFITDDTCGLELGYKYNAFDYILKPVTKNRIGEAIKRLFFYIDNSNSYFYIKIGGTIERFRDDSILYFSSSGRKVTLNTMKTNIDFYAKMNEVYDQLDVNKFYRIHQSFIINIGHVMKASKTQVLMDNGDIIPISKKYVNTLSDVFY